MIKRLAVSTVSLSFDIAAQAASHVLTSTTHGSSLSTAEKPSTNRPVFIHPIGYRRMLHDLSKFCLADRFDRLSRFELRECYQFVVRVAKADVWGQFEVEGVSGLGFLKCKHAVVQI